jgi:hypothetical protein
MAGLVLNDLHDLAEDRVRRPERPLVRGAIGARTAGLAFALLAVLGLCAAVWAGGLRGVGAAGALLGLICLYDLGAKARPTSACLVMGLCRGGSLLLGACVSGGPGAALVPALALTAYIGSVTWLSRREDETQRPGVAIVVLPLALAVGVLAVGLPRPPEWPLGLLGFGTMAGLAVGGASRISLGLYRREVGPQRARAAVGQFIGLLLPWQAALIVSGGTAGTAAVAVALLMAWPLSRALARHVSAS